MSELGDKADTIYELLTRIWLQLPSFGSGGSHWSIEEKDDFLVLANESNQGDTPRIKKVQEKKIAKIQEILNNLSELEIHNSMVVELFSSLVNAEDLERIIERHNP